MFGYIYNSFCLFLWVCDGDFLCSFAFLCFDLLFRNFSKEETVEAETDGQQVTTKPDDNSNDLKDSMDLIETMRSDDISGPQIKRFLG